MSDQETTKTVENKPEIEEQKKLQTPRMHQVVLYDGNPDGFIRGCGVRVLMDTFNMVAQEAFEHVVLARMNRRHVVVEAPKEIADAQAKKANGFRDMHIYHGGGAEYLEFKAEPAPEPNTPG